tara:strand:- start:211 stop:321 length:111 start_codon:yes stop_codon:yes gene_type:complete
MTTPEFWAEQSIIAPYQQKSANYGLQVQSSHSALKE